MNIENAQVQMRKGILEFCILHIISRGEVYAEDLKSGIALLKDENEVFVLGGASVFEQALPLAEKLYLTIVHTTVEGDAFFPKLSWDEWELISSEYHEIDLRHQYAFSMNLYLRKETMEK